ncbi:MAG TPA: serine/threonine-protein kinase [Acidimicrobiales bacterium]|nr:serine/threonine-protein kinase [Acidimicrobiales bacterium]
MSRSAGDQATTGGIGASAGPDGAVSALLDDRYLVGEVLGRGATGVVHRAFDTRLGRQVAVKVLRGADPDDEARFAAEVRTLAVLAHPHLVRLLDAGELHGRPCLVMELVEGPTLAGMLASGALRPSWVAHTGAAVASALAYVHRAGVVHRDVKPANILVDNVGVPRLADFGIARLVDATGMTATGVALGTPAYLAPEQVAGDAVTSAADVYSLGLVLIECLTGQRAFDGTAAEMAAARLQRDPVVPHDFGAPWHEVLAALTARDPATRPPAAAVAGLLAALDDAGAAPDAVLGTGTPAFAVTTAALATAAQADATAGDPGDVTAALDATRPTRVRGVPGARAPRRRVVGAVLGALALAGFGVGLGVGLSRSTPPTSPSGRSHASASGARLAGAHTSRSPRETAASTTTTVAPATTSPAGAAPAATTPAPPASSPPSPLETAAGAFDGALRAGVEQGDVAPQVGSALESELAAVLAGPGPGGAGQVGSFDRLVQTYDAALAYGSVAGTATESSLGAALAALGTALGTSEPQFVPAGPVAGPGAGPVTGPGHGHGHGHGHDG